MSNTALAKITQQVMWDRLIAVVEEQAQTLIRTAFGTVVREAGDLSAGVYDLRGRMIAQAVTGTPGHVNTMATAVEHFLQRFPVETMKEGDIYVTNDPWLGTGHLFDFVVLTPTFRHGKMIGLFASTCHFSDIGGIGFSANARSIFEEGLYVPHMKLADQGRYNETFLQILEANVRTPVEVKGDLLSLVSSNEAGGRRLVEMMDEFALDGVEELSNHINDASRAGMLAAIRKLKPGSYRSEMTTDGYENQLRFVLTMTVSEEGIHVDYDGTSRTSMFGINSPKCYTDAYTAFGIKCILAPYVPNNAGALGTITISAPENTIVNALPPCAVASRHVIGQMLPDAVFGCLHQVVPGGVPAESSGSLWSLKTISGHYAGDVKPEEIEGTTRFITTSISVGGMGARPTKDGLSSTAFPSGVRNIPVEVVETNSPLLFRRREFLPESGGIGKFRGGHSHVAEVFNTEQAAFAVSAGTWDRLRNPTRGREGGSGGRPGRVQLSSGRSLTTKSIHTVPAGDSLIAELPGGGGYGDPLQRDPKLVAEEVLNELISVDTARTAYGVVCSPQGVLDEPATSALRKSLGGAS